MLFLQYRQVRIIVYFFVIIVILVKWWMRFSFAGMHLVYGSLSLLILLECLVLLFIICFILRKRVKKFQRESTIAIPLPPVRECEGSVAITSTELQEFPPDETTVSIQDLPTLQSAAGTVHATTKVAEACLWDILFYKNNFLLILNIFLYF